MVSVRGFGVGVGDGTGVADGIGVVVGEGNGVGVMITVFVGGSDGVHAARQTTSINVNRAVWRFIVCYLNMLAL